MLMVHTYPGRFQPIPGFILGVVCLFLSPDLCTFRQGWVVEFVLSELPILLTILWKSLM